MLRQALAAAPCLMLQELGQFADMMEQGSDLGGGRERGYREVDYSERTWLLWAEH